MTRLGWPISFALGCFTLLTWAISADGQIQPIPPTNTPQVGGGVVLAADIGASDPTIKVNSTTSLGSSGTIMIDNEIMNYVVVNATQLSVTRGVFGSKAVAHAAGSVITKVIPVPTPTPVIRIDVGSAAGRPGSTVQVSVSLTTSGATVVATANDISFDASALSLDLSECQINPALHKMLLASTLSAGLIRVFVESDQNADPIPDGLLYTCSVRIASSTLPGNFRLTNSTQLAFSPGGMSLSGVAGRSGVIVVSLVPVTCTGDCNADGEVSIDELIMGVAIALGSLPLGACSTLDFNGDGTVTVNELIAAVNNALYGCGVTPLVFHVEGFNGNGLNQADAVGPTAAQVDVVQDLCGTAPPLTPERFTQTEINAVFSNHQALDIHLEAFSLHVNDSRVGLGDFTGTLTGTILGGRCSSQTDKTCAIDDDCVQAGQGTTSATCTHQLTTINGIVLFDFAAKAQVAGQPNAWGQALPVTITFFAADATQSFQTSGGYLVTFVDFDNCSSTSTGA